MAKGKKKPAKKAAKKSNSRKKPAPVPVAESVAVGRPSKYDPLYADQVEKLCKLGATDAEIAEFFDVSESTVNLWKIEHAEFSESVKRGKVMADAEVAHAFHKRATGYKYDEVTYEKVGAGEDLMEVGENGMESVKQDQFRKKVVTKEVAPDAGAALNWLKNRQKDKWRDKSEHDVTSKGESINKPMSDEQFNQIVNMLNGTESSKGERVEKAT